jgi:RNA polymerase sigma factor (TIGR02999 family)
MAAEDDLEAMVEALYPQLRMIAGSLSSRFGAPETLRSTALVSEAFMKLRRSPRFADEQHFLRTAARAMRHILINHARARSAAKRDAGAPVLPLDDDAPVFWGGDTQLLALDDALRRLEALEPRLALVVECRFFGGYDEAETGRLLGVSDRTVRRDWMKARAWLQGEMGAATDHSSP